MANVRNLDGYTIWGEVMKLLDTVFRRRERIRQIRLGKVVRLDIKRPKLERVVSLREVRK